ncbi:B12-binding domain-containing radical SAM protein [Paramagnetospirillum magneticum]|uniref:Fe-S oxidoreductase n=1 Tax=Paramagnetospirillum magneticum (strain ATCC 700264 / AMB-1) TaxID=342108 RepID=Q2W262_PARM1|nr:radical SAM protein [Paramagnetospirillum magneticum]BAE52063.1 Fe-S oxidoreductase [Paramagnetospirillum magneticum AMB-1]
MNQLVKVSLVDPQTQQMVEAVGENVRFSAYRCFPMTGEPHEVDILARVSASLGSMGGKIAFWKSGPFLDFFTQTVPQVLDCIAVVIDELGEAEDYKGRPLVRSIDDLPPDITAIFICETKTEPRWRLERRVPAGINVFSPDSVKQFIELVPPHCWIPQDSGIYPFDIPGLKLTPGLDLVLLDLPSKAGLQISVGLSYVHSALKRSSVRFQTLDADIIMYHRFHVRRLFDLGEQPLLRNGIRFADDPWGYNERLWIDPRQWPLLLDYFAPDIDEIFRELKAARPKVLGMSVHQRNEWISRELARRVKREMPETMILVGGHSCVSETFGRGAFPEYDYMVIGEADMVVGPLVEQLARGERPANLPGVISKFDDPGRRFIPGPKPHNLDALGGIALDFFDDINAVYRSSTGYQGTAVPLTRGCVWSRCTFCAERFSFRSRSPSLYVDELERIMATGRNPSFSASDSDFGGEPEVLRQICEEIVRRGLRLVFSGQIRVNKKYDVEFLSLMKAAGVVGLNFGADAFTENTIRLQRKGYTIETLIKNHEDCVKAGITPNINIVIGTPGETEKDIDDTIEFFKDNRSVFPLVNNINMCLLLQSSVYWLNPEGHGIGFYGDKEAIYKKYYFGVPDHLWYSINPYVDKGVRAERFVRLVKGLQAANIPIGGEVLANMHDALSGGGHTLYRQWIVDEEIMAGNPGRIALPDKAEAVGRSKIFDNHLIVPSAAGDILALPYDDGMDRALKSLKIVYWSKDAVQQ